MIERAEVRHVPCGQRWVKDGQQMLQGAGVGYFIRVFSHTDLSHFLVSHKEAEAKAVAATQASASASC